MARESKDGMKAKGWSVFWRPAKNRWVLSRVVAGKWEQKVLPDAPHEDTPAAKKTAERIAQTWMAEQGERPGEAGERAAMTVADACQRWLALAERKVADRLIAPATLRDYKIDVKCYILPHFGAHSIASIDVPAGRAWLREIRGTKSASTVRGARSSMATLFDCAIAEGWIKGSNPFENKSLLDEQPPLPVPPSPQIIPITWVQALVNATTVPIAWRARYALAVTSGARDGEIHGARLCDLRLDDEVPSWRIEQATAIVGREGFATENNTKTRSSVRTLPLHPVAVVLLRAWLAEGWVLWTGREPTALDLVFPGEDGKASRPRSAEELRRDLVHVGHKEQLDGKPVEFKSFRATFATALAEAGVDEPTRQRLLGHASRTVTERHYTRRELERLSEAVCRVPLVAPVTNAHVVTPVTEVCADHMNCSDPGQSRTADQRFRNPAEDCGPEHQARHELGSSSLGREPLSGYDIGGDRAAVASGHKELAGVVAGLALLRATWDALDGLVANDVGDGAAAEPPPARRAAA